MSRFLLPLSIFIVLVAFLGIGLRLNPRAVPSSSIDKRMAGVQETMTWMLQPMGPIRQVTDSHGAAAALRFYMPALHGWPS